MATPIKRIEKEFYLGSLCTKETPLKCFIEKKEHTFTLQEIDNDQLTFDAKRKPAGFYKNMKIDFMFSVQTFRPAIITFSVYVTTVHGKRITTTVPDYLYKNLQRVYSRVQMPPELSITMKKAGCYYDMPYEKAVAPAAFAAAAAGFAGEDGEKKLSAAIAESFDWIRLNTDGYKLTLFKKTPAAAIEEKAVGTLGKVFFVDMKSGGYPCEADDQGLLITGPAFKEFVSARGETLKAADETLSRALLLRTENNIRCDCLLPVICHGFIVGYIRVWINEGADDRSLTPDMIEKLIPFAALTSLSLERYGAFSDCKREHLSFAPYIQDISAGGFLFSLKPDKDTASFALKDTFSVIMTTAGRLVHCRAVIVREYGDRNEACYGCKIEGMELEDIRFLFETLYGRPITDKDLEFITGSV
jgi:hypothetical protein